MSNAVPGLPGLLAIFAIFFDIGNRKLARLLYFPGLDVGPYAEVLGGLHHCVISVEPARWNEIVRRLDDTGVEHVIHSDVSVYFRAPTAPASSSSPTRSDRCTDTHCCDERSGHRDRRPAPPWPTPLLHRPCVEVADDHVGTSGFGRARGAARSAGGVSLTTSAQATP